MAFFAAYHFPLRSLCAARSVRAALDQGFVAVGVGMPLGMLTEAQGEAVNAKREDGFYAGARALLLAKLDADRANRTSTRESIVVRPRVAEAGPREPACIAAAPVAAEPLRDGARVRAAADWLCEAVRQEASGFG